MTQTRAAVLVNINEPLKIEELTIPPLREGQVLVKMAFSGICHSQLLEIRGRRGVDPYLPHTLGHEGAGTVAESGPGVTRVAPGDTVILSWIKGRGIDAPAPTYFQGNQKINGGPLTTLQEFTVASENRLTPIDEETPLDKAALIGCSVATGAGAIFNTAQVKEGDSVAVFGVGGVGLCAVRAAVLKKAGRVIAIDQHEHKLTWARRWGATHAVNSKREDPLEKVLHLTEGRGVDYAIEAAGSKETMEWAFRCVRPKGGLAILVGNLPPGTKISIDPFELIRGKRLVGSWGGETDPERDFPYYLDLDRKGGLNLEDLITHRFRLEEVNAAFEALEKGEVARALIEFS